MTVTLEPGDMLEVLPRLLASGAQFDACVCDPPYHLTSIVERFGADGAAPAKGDVYNRSSRGFMGKEWDGGDIAFRPETWRAVYDVLKPGAYLLAFAGTRGYHRMACAIEDAGFEVRDMISWLYGSGFPKSHDVSKGIDRASGAEREVVGVRTFADGTSARATAGSAGIPASGAAGQSMLTAPATDAASQWAGWGTALKPACEPICMARKPLIGTVAQNVLAHGTGALNIDASRIGTEGGGQHGHAVGAEGWGFAATPRSVEPIGRWPANVIHDGSAEVLEAFGSFGEKKTGICPAHASGTNAVYGKIAARGTSDRAASGGDDGTAARFFYCAKADAEDRAGSSHPTVKPVELMRHLVRLVTPPGGHVIDPFAGSGTTLQAAHQCGMHATGIERDPQYQADILKRMELVYANKFAKRATVEDEARANASQMGFGF